MVLATVVIVCGAVAHPGRAAPPWQALMPFKRVASDPNGDYGLREGHGPWMILATSFAGPGAREEAQRLILELRKRYQLPAYLHSKRYDYSQSVTGLGLNRYGEPKKMRYAQPLQYDEYAVLVGDFASIDDPQVEKTLERIKHLNPDCLQLQPGKGTTRRFAGLRHVQRLLNRDPEKAGKGPMGNAFVTRNPLLPQEFFSPSSPDALVMRMNQGVPYGLLDCPAKYSVRVATFRGSVIIDQREVQEIESGGMMESHLEEAAVKAHRLTQALRERGVEAYEFHDRHESIVTVGSFDSIGTPRADGKLEIEPAVLQVMQTYGPQRQPLPGSDAQRMAGLIPKMLGGIPFDIQPVPVAVPRKSIGADYARGGPASR